MNKLSQEKFFRYVVPFISKMPKDPMYISNHEIADFLTENNFYPDTEEYGAIKKFFLEEMLLKRNIFSLLEERYKKLIKNNETKCIPFEKKFLQIMQARRYSWKTIKSYTHSLRQLNIWSQNKNSKYINELNEDRLLEYFFYLVNEKSISLSTQNITRSAIFFYFRNILNRNIKLASLRNTNKPKRLPNVLLKDDILAILAQISNPKHKLAISLLYSSGFRISELVKLRIGNIILQNLTIKIRGKGNKERITIFSKNLTEDLLADMKGKRPDDYLFESSHKPGSHLSARSIQKVFKKALEKSGVQKNASCHDLRHSFATHLMENGVDIRFIQKLLGHKNITTTTVYTQVMDPAIMKIRSPL